MKHLLLILKSDEKEKQRTNGSVISDAEYKELKYDLSKYTIARVLSNLEFEPMNSEMWYEELYCDYNSL